ncbi:MAG: YtxH domain-containing protein [Gemmatimonadetes bacterium]|nr:YtxH domain-containing protein [Gemmatimonadota bacterium]MBT8402958.1 YtxH domain-containing protein [Gemmatimonadota bacterium]NNF37623.1 YtxH domain-containing protein [Gemmatimonadota bacterium]NNK63096.1 YtxH domain-containing protein [Gemmatimonadota bacterium]
MEYDEHSTQVVNFVAGLALGAVLGAGIALLTAPHSGRRTRRQIRRTAVDVRSQAGDRWEDLAEDVKNRVDDALDGARTRFKR